MKKNFDYRENRYGKKCLELAAQCKTDVGFGAVLVKGNKIIGTGRNRRATDLDRASIPYTDYAIHAEQSAILDAIQKGFNVEGAEVYVLGLCLQGEHKGKLTTRKERIFVCNKCPHSLIKYNISVNIPHVSGWMNIPPSEAFEIGKRVANKGYWKEFVKNHE